MNNFLEKKEENFVIQQNIISRSIYSCSPMTRKVLAYTMSLVTQGKIDKKGWVKMDLKDMSDFRDSLGVGKSWRTGEEVKRALKEASRVQVILEDVSDAENEDYRFSAFMWISNIRYNWILGICEIQLNDEMREYSKKALGHTVMNLMDLGKLQSYYAIRFYEIALSFSGFKGKNGNKKDEWYFEYSLDELRTIFKTENKYKVTKDFKHNCIEVPLRELNSSDIGLSITAETLKRGRSISGFKLLCKELKRNEKIANPKTYTYYNEEKELEKITQENEKLINAYPVQYSTFLEEELAQKELFEVSAELHYIGAEGRAIKRLKEHLKTN